MKATRGFILLLFLGAILLTACERPLQDEDDLALPPTLDPATQPTFPAPATPAPVDPYPAPGTPGDVTPEATGEAVDPTDTTDDGGEQQEDIIHVVVAGDTLGELAQLYDVSVEAIAEANNLSNVNDLEVGQELIIPLSAGTNDADTGTDTDSDPDPTVGGEEQVHIVQRGETLYRIGLAYGFTVAELATYNDLANPDSLEIGQEILIPPEGYEVP